MLPSIDRKRRIVTTLALLASVTPLKAAQLLLTPPQVRGPFYPLELPLDQDNDLTQVAGQSSVAKGEAADIFGQVLDAHGNALPNVRVEIWQANAFGRYHHAGDRQNQPVDPNFQGYGRFVTGPDGGYRFRTIKPVPYPGRAPHIHFALSGSGFAPRYADVYCGRAGKPTRSAFEQHRRLAAARAADRRFAKKRGGDSAGPLQYRSSGKVTKEKI
jgi:protocatechuate 3,4-dioxygenase, beta subunit